MPSARCSLQNMPVVTPGLFQYGRVMHPEYAQRLCETSIMPSALCDFQNAAITWPGVFQQGRLGH